MIKMFAVLFFAKMPSKKYVHWNKPIFFDFESPLYVLFLKNGATKTIDYIFWPDLPLSSASYPHTRFIDET